MKESITLRGDDAEQFRGILEAKADARDGNEPSNAEMLRILMEDYSGEDPSGGLRR